MRRVRVAAGPGQTLVELGIEPDQRVDVASLEGCERRLGRAQRRLAQVGEAARRFAGRELLEHEPHRVEIGDGDRIGARLRRDEALGAEYQAALIPYFSHRAEVDQPSETGLRLGKQPGAARQPCVSRSPVRQLSQTARTADFGYGVEIHWRHLDGPR